MPTRHDSWTALHASYLEQPHTGELIARELAAVCLVLCDAEWASDIHPFCSHGQLGLSTAPNYTAARQRRGVWLGASESQHPIATFQEKFGSKAVKTERVAELSETALRALVAWVRGSGQ